MATKLLAGLATKSSSHIRSKMADKGENDGRKVFMLL